MSTRSPILEYSDNNPIPTYTAPVGDLTTDFLLWETGDTFTAENGDFIQTDAPSSH